MYPCGDNGRCTPQETAAGGGTGGETGGDEHGGRQKNERLSRRDRVHVKSNKMHAGKGFGMIKDDVYT